MKKLLFVFGTRPEAIKMCPIILELRSRGYNNFKVILTGQHKEMLLDVMASFGVSYNLDLSVMKESQGIEELCQRVLCGLSRVYKDEDPGLVVVHGDTTTAFSASLAAFYLGIKVAHVEAGLRSFDRLEPFPEEFNRRAIALMADIHFAPTEIARANLISEGIPEDRIFVTGNTVIDALKIDMTADEHYADLGSEYLLMTVHRRENHEKLDSVFGAVYEIARGNPGINIVYPVHKNPKIRKTAERYFSGVKNIILKEPMPVREFHKALIGCLFLLTDSGGATEEAAYIGKPTLVLRERSERTELAKCSGVILIGTDKESIVSKVNELIESRDKLDALSKPTDLYGTGDASAKIADVLEKI